MKNFMKCLLCATPFIYFSALHAEIAVEVPANVVISVPEPQSEGKKNEVMIRNLPGDCIYFLNGDILHGNLVSIKPESGILWQNDEARDQILFDAKNIKEIQLNREENLSEQKSRVILTNGDELPGTVVELDGEFLKYKTDYAATLNIKRAMIDRILPGGQELEVIYSGPSSIEGWIAGQNRQKGWTYRDRALYALGRNASIGKDVDIPDLARIDFQMSWRDRPNMYVYFYTDQINNPGGNAYMLSLSGDHVSLQRYSNQQGSRDLGNVNIPQLGIKGEANFTLLSDKTKKSFSLLIDNTLVKQWTDPADFAGGGTGLLFYCHQVPAKVNNIRISEWNGEIDLDFAPEADGNEDTIIFINGDRVKGKLNQISNQSVAFTTEYAVLEIPLPRVKVIVLGHDQRQRARRNKGDIQAIFSSYGMVTFELTAIENGKVTGSSENFGDSSFVINAFKKIRINIYDDRHQQESDEEAFW